MGANLIACLLPALREVHNKPTWDAIRIDENRSRYIPFSAEAIRSTHSSRESTASIDDEEEPPDPATCPRLQLTFDNGPKVGQEFVIGKDANCCDIVLPKHPKISRRHCHLTFDAQRRLVLRDTSTHGTTVSYNGNGGQKRQTLVTYDNRGQEIRNYFTWILSGKDLPNKTERILIDIQNIHFAIDVSKHEAHPDLYMKNVDRFLQCNDELRIGGLGVQSTTSTAEQSHALTPSLQPHPPIYIDQERLGSGNFSIVKRVWNVSTGFSYASKEIFNMKESEWRREVEILRRVSQLSNQHIVQFVALLETPFPHLIMEYLPLGNLETLERITYEESLAVLCQSLDALTSVHELGIVHRDIKPENILVQSRNPLQIKLSDFGLSKATADLQTFCGTHLYAAPEIYTTRRGIYYTKSCDIWSLGVVVYKYAYGPLPKFHKDKVGLRWCQRIIKQLHDWDSDDLVDLLSSAMLIIEPESRLSARTCWEHALQLSRNRCLTPTQASYNASHLSNGNLALTPSFRAKEFDSALDQGDFVSQRQGPLADPDCNILNHEDSLAPTEIQGSLWPNVFSSNSYASEPAYPRKRSMRASSSSSSSTSRIFKRREKAVPNCSLPSQNTGNESVAKSGDTARGRWFGTPADEYQGVDDIGYSHANEGQHDQEKDQKLSLAVLEAHKRSATPSAESFTDESRHQVHSVVRFSPLETLDHLSTRSLRFDREGLIYIVIRRHAVAMRTTDYRLNATQICNVAGLDRVHRLNYMKILRTHCDVTIIRVQGESQHSWVPFKDGVFLCQALELCDELKLLFLQASANIPREEENYFLNPRRREKKPSAAFLNRSRRKGMLPAEYEALQWDDKFVVYMPSVRRVNATHLLKLSNIPRTQLARFFSHNHQVSKQVVVGSAQVQGTYIDFEDAQLLCRHFNLSEDPVDEIIRRERAPGTSVLGDHEDTNIYYPESTYDFEDGDRYQEDTSMVPDHPLEGPATAVKGFVACKDFQAKPRHAEPVMNTDHYSQYTEPSYKYGSFIAPANQSVNSA